MTHTPKHGTRTEYMRWGCRCDSCREATRLYDQERRNKNPEIRAKALDSCRRYAARYPERRRASAAAWRKRNPEKVAAQQKVRAERFRLKKYAVTRAEHERLLKQQDGKCAICGSADSRALSIDHCHATSAVRGLLCRRCNMGLGCFGDNVTTLRAAATYLQGRSTAATV